MPVYGTLVRRAGLALLATSLLTACGNDQPAPAAPDASATAASAPPASGPSVEAIRAATTSVDSARIRNADSEPGNWLAHGRTYSEQRYSPLDSINTDSVGQLGLAWFAETGTKRGLEATPIVVDGVMFTTGSWSTVFAHDARTGKQLWQFDPQVPREWGRYVCCDVVNRGAAVWKGKVYFGTLDGRLIALDAATGSKVWEVQTTDRERAYSITGAPRVFNDMVVIGNGGAEYGVRGYVTAYDTETGAQKWRFFTVPGNPAEPFEGPHLEKAAGTWFGGKWWEVGGGGTVWDSMVYDPDLNLLYIGVGNGSPWNRYIRSPGGGDNLYLSSIVAINPDDGSMVWYYQTTPGDAWDYTATQHIMLADLEIDGQPRKVLMQAPKNGFFYVIDRTNGELLSAEAYVPVTWATHIDRETGRPVENPDALYANDAKVVKPGPLGGHNWHPMSFSPKTGLVYVPALDLEFKYGQDNAFQYDAKSWNLGVDFALSAPAPTIEERVDGLKKVGGFLTARDPVTQKEVWRVQHSSSWNGGLLSTAGNLVFQGRSDGKFAAYKADTGELVWESPVQTGIIAAPISYSVDGEQYIAVVAGWGGAFAVSSGMPMHKDNVVRDGRILAFKLGGAEKLPEPDVMWVNVPTPPEFPSTPEQVKQGEVLFTEYCSVCHGAGVTSGSGLPDLRFMAEGTHAAFNAIVLDGAFTGKGMPRFDHVLDKAGADAVHAYIISETKGAVDACKAKWRQEYPEFFDTICERAEPAVPAGG